MKQQMEKAKWIEAIGDLAELIFVDGVWFATGPSNVEKMFEPPYFEWYQANKVFQVAIPCPSCTIASFSLPHLHRPEDCFFCNRIVVDA